jgi:hypothetical protein
LTRLSCSKSSTIDQKQGPDAFSKVILALDHHRVEFHDAGFDKRIFYKYSPFRRSVDVFFKIFSRILNEHYNLFRDSASVIFHEAARLKSSYKCAIADAIGLAAAKELSATFVTSDHSELEAVEKSEQIPFLWLPPRLKK